MRRWAIKRGVGEGLAALARARFCLALVYAAEMLMRRGETRCLMAQAGSIAARGA